MKKTKIILASIGGVALLGVLIVGWLMFNAFSTKAELTEDLEMDEMKLNQLRSAKVAPTHASLKQVETNKTVLTNWLATTYAAVAVGDRATDLTQTDASFKSKMIDDARELAALPGSAAGKIVKDNFGFGYNDFITGGKMPSVNELPELQNRWADIVTLVKLFATSGVKEVVEVAVLASEAPKEDTPAARDKRPVNRTKAKEAEAESKITRRGYAFKLRADAPALIRVLNACATDKRFILIDSLNFARAEDEIANRIGESNKAAQGNSGRRRRRASAAAEFAQASAEEVARKGLVIDPTTVTPFVVTLRVTTVDFGSHQVEKKGEVSK